MTGQELLDLMRQANRRAHVTGTQENGVIAGLDLEGRLFTVVGGRVLNRVVPSAILGRSNKTSFLNPGGDALWPAPEGNRFGYEYSTGNWRVPPAITGAVWEVADQSAERSVIRAEIDLINNSQTGLPCEFERQITIELQERLLIQRVTEVIRYTGTKTLAGDEFRLAPWSLCQFDAGPGTRIIMPAVQEEDIRDMYEPSHSKRQTVNGRLIVNADTDFRFQLGLGARVPWIQYEDGKGIRVKRYAGKVPSGQHLIDISDIAPDRLPSERGVSLSVYCDPSGFTEMEACGGSTGVLAPGTELSVSIVTEYELSGE